MMSEGSEDVRCLMELPPRSYRTVSLHDRHRSHTPSAENDHVGSRGLVIGADSLTQVESTNLAMKSILC